MSYRVSTLGDTNDVVGGAAGNAGFLAGLTAALRGLAGSTKLKGEQAAGVITAAAGSTSAAGSLVGAIKNIGTSVKRVFTGGATVAAEGPIPGSESSTILGLPPIVAIAALGLGGIVIARKVLKKNKKKRR